jgi:signal transduction histidine kinase
LPASSEPRSAGYLLEPGSRSVLRQVFQQGQAMLLRQVGDAVLAQAAESPEHLHWLRSLGLISAAFVPLQARGQTLGVLALFTTRHSGLQLGPEDLAVAEEIGRRAALAVENARLYAETRDAVRLRDEFLSIASHELRTPVAGMSGAAQLLLRLLRTGRFDTERAERYLLAIERTAGHLARLTEQLLDVARLRQGRLPLELREVDLAELVRAAVEQHTREDAPPVHLELSCEPCPIQADPDRLEQVLTNLLDNAIKYSPRGEAISIALGPRDEGVLLSVCDHGIGLPPGASEQIFEPFGRAQNAAQQHIPGLGLGLYVCRQIAERHGGRLWADSPGEGLGTTLHLWLPRDGAADLVDRKG